MKVQNQEQTKNTSTREVSQLISDVATIVVATYDDENLTRARGIVNRMKSHHARSNNVTDEGGYIFENAEAICLAGELVSRTLEVADGVLAICALLLIYWYPNITSQQLVSDATWMSEVVRLIAKKFSEMN